MSCPFCESIQEDELIFETELAFAKVDLFPVSLGHTLVIPKRHYGNLFESTYEELQDFVEVIERTKEHIEEFCLVDGYNIGVNIGEHAGQTVDHVHIHIIPRYKGDVEDPRGGVRWVIPDKANYLKERQMSCFDFDYNGQKQRSNAWMSVWNLCRDHGMKLSTNDTGEELVLNFIRKLFNERQRFARKIVEQDELYKSMKKVLDDYIESEYE